MTSSPLRSKTSFHARSISLPSRSHPLIPQFDDRLCRIKASEATSSSLPSISNRLSGLEELYDCVDDLLQLPQTQQVFTHECNQKWVDEALAGHLRLLDTCAIAKDVFSQTKQDVQQLLSMLCKRWDANDFGAYLTSQKKVKKVIQKSLKDLRRIRNNESLLALDKDHQTVEIVSMLTEVEAVTAAAFESLLSYVAGSKVQSRPTTWSLMSKLMHQKSVSQHDEAEMNEFEKVATALHSLTGHKTSKFDNIMNVENLQNQLGKMDSLIQDAEEKLECLFRRLIRTRVSLLNILSQ
ncbi:uncharacterized protein LOC132295680 [Cornus florida]|uniref:uncharacterized protein LOC132295680 n=1 Tax=Cornus florida TaxID=4283 RepID=UPI0028A161A4|nr:uncharacterized protein LOC132295680 [Cornus florida]